MQGIQALAHSCLQPLKFTTQTTKMAKIILTFYLWLNLYYDDFGKIIAEWTRFSWARFNFNCIVLNTFDIQYQRVEGNYLFHPPWNCFQHRFQMFDGVTKGDFDFKICLTVLIFKYHCRFSRDKCTKSRYRLGITRFYQRKFSMSGIPNLAKKEFSGPN